ncbi:MAG: SOS response-associated peptidase [Phycisphaerales bacterium]|nr:SOS response-associated peptidase [Phycisphaerales bacterium]
MCGRYSHLFTWKQLHRLMDLLSWPEAELGARYNVAPTQHGPVVRARPDGSREGAMLRWGLIPHWAKDESIGGRLINARAESVHLKPAFRAAFQRRRCLVPVSGFFEWRAVPGSTRKRAHYIRPRAEELFAFAGLWERWTPPDGAPAPDLETFTILTTDANDAIRPLHDRMPVILPPRAWSAWLDPDLHEADAIRPMLAPAPAESLEIVAVGSRVNSPRHDDPQCIEPVEDHPLTGEQRGFWPDNS